MTDTQQSVAACRRRRRTSKNTYKKERNEWISERKNKHINENVYIYIARVGASSLIGMSKKWKRKMMVDFCFIPQRCQYVQSNRLMSIYLSMKKK